MNIQSCDIYAYDLPLSRPLYVGGQMVDQRQGFIIHLRSDDGYEGFGEAAPLEGLSRETFKEVKETLLGLSNELPGQSIPERLEQLDGTLTEWLKPYVLGSSAQFGVESALLTLIADAREKTLHDLICDNGHTSVHVSGLLHGPTDAVLCQARDLLKEGFQSMKLKVGGDDIDQDIAKVQAISRVIQGKALLHLDANQAWDLKQALVLGNEVGCAAVEYIEEPLRDTAGISVFFEKTLIPAALDESLLDHDFEQINSLEGVDILVLKPTILGGIERVWAFMHRAKQLALRVVVSSFFESSIGLSILANLAGCQDRDYPAGLDTLKYFKDNLFLTPLSIQNGTMNIQEKRLKENCIQFNQLKKL